MTDDPALAGVQPQCKIRLCALPLENLLLDLQARQTETILGAVGIQGEHRLKERSSRGVPRWPYRLDNLIKGCIGMLERAQAGIAATLDQFGDMRVAGQGPPDR